MLSSPSSSPPAGASRPRGGLTTYIHIRYILYTLVVLENDFLFFRLMIDWMFSRGIEKQTQAFLDGFNDVLPLKWLQYFDEMELEVGHQGLGCTHSILLFFQENRLPLGFQCVYK